MSIYYARLKASPGGGYVAGFPGLLGAVTQGETHAEALAMAADCLRAYFLGRIALGLDAPAAPAPRGRSGGDLHPVALPALETARIELYRTFRASGMRKSQLAAGMGIPRAHVDRLLDLNHASRLNQIEAAFRVLGKKLVIQTRAVKARKAA